MALLVRRFTLASSLIVLAGLGPLTAHAAFTALADRYVAPTGSGSLCSQAQPCGGLNAAYQAASPGEEVRVAAGTYGDQTINADSKPSSDVITFLPAAGTQPTLGDLTTFASNVRYVGFNVTPGEPTVRDGASVVVEDMTSSHFYVVGPTQDVTILGGEYGPYESTGGGAHIKTWTQGGDGPIQDQPHDTVVDGVYMHDFTVPSGSSAHLDCLHVFHHDGLIVRNSTFENCEHYGILWGSNGPSQDEAGDLAEDNTFSGSGIAGLAYRGEAGVEAFENGPDLIGNTASDGLNPQTANTLSGITWEGNHGSITPCRTGITYIANVVPNVAGRCGPTDVVAGDTSPPSVSITAPASGATVSGVVQVSASASDDVGVAGVQFKLDGQNLGAEDTSTPYEVSWDTDTATDGSHTLTAVARDTTGNTKTANDVPVTVDNSEPPDGLVAAYAFDEATGVTVTDHSANANTGTIAGATRSVAGRFGGALSFDGVNDWVSVADSASLDLTSAMTLEAWVRPTAAGSSWRTVVLKEQPAQLAYALYSNEGTNRPSGHVYVSGDQNTQGSSGSVPLNAWTHLAATYDGTTLRLFVDGTQVSSEAVSGAISTSSSPLRIGGNAVWPEWFAGLIDEVRVYNRALTGTEIQADMTTPVSP